MWVDPGLKSGISVRELKQTNNKTNKQTKRKEEVWKDRVPDTQMLEMNIVLGMPLLSSSDGASSADILRLKDGGGGGLPSTLCWRTSLSKASD